LVCLYPAGGYCPLYLVNDFQCVAFVTDPVCANIILHALPDERQPKQRGRTRKYGTRLGSTTEVARQSQGKARTIAVFLYGKQREVKAYDKVVMLKNLRCPAPGCLGLQKNPLGGFF